MNPNENYWLRVVGPWQWTVDFKLISLSGLWFSSLKLIHKLRATMMILFQVLFGHFDMKTLVEFDETRKSVVHHVGIEKWGVSFYRSLKYISLDTNGFDLKFEGNEYFWPVLNSPKPFYDLKARVEESFTAAKYEWPFFERTFPCQTLLGKNQGVICLDAGWLICTFRLTDKSLQELNGRG